MLLSIATTHRPATDLGFLLHKHPERVHETELGFGTAYVFYPEASEARCEAALLLDVDPIGLVRGKGSGDGLLDQYVNDRPYAASSFLSVAMARALRTAMGGTSRERPELAEQAIPLEATVTPLPARGGEKLVRELFEPLGWKTDVEPTRIAHHHSKECPMAEISGWYVRVTTGAIADQVYDTVLYLVGFATPEEALEAVRATRPTPGEKMEVLGDPAILGLGPQPKPGEVRLLTGAV